LIDSVVDGGLRRRAKNPP